MSKSPSRVLQDLGEYINCWNFEGERCPIQLYYCYMELLGG